MEAMLRTGRFAEFVREVITMHNAETEEKTLWEAWLHKCYDKTFDEFRRALGAAQEAGTEGMTGRDLADTVRQSAEMLKGFRPGKDEEG